MKRLIDWLIKEVASLLMFVQARHDARQQRRTIEDALLLMDAHRHLEEHEGWDAQMREAYNLALDAVLERAGVVGCARIVLMIVEQRLDPTQLQEVRTQIAELRSHRA